MNGWCEASLESQRNNWKMHGSVYEIIEWRACWGNKRWLVHIDMVSCHFLLFFLTNENLSCSWFRWGNSARFEWSGNSKPRPLGRRSSLSKTKGCGTVSIGSEECMGRMRRVHLAFHINYPAFMRKMFFVLILFLFLDEMGLISFPVKIRFHTLIWQFCPFHHLYIYIYYFFLIIYTSYLVCSAILSTTWWSWSPSTCVWWLSAFAQTHTLTWKLWWPTLTCYSATHASSTSQEAVSSETLSSCANSCTSGSRTCLTSSPVAEAGSGQGWELYCLLYNLTGAASVKENYCCYFSKNYNIILVKTVLKINTTVFSVTTGMTILLIKL